MNTQHAVNACVSCSTSKRKCDRLKPSCTRCFDSHRECVYDGERPPSEKKGLPRSHLGPIITAQQQQLLTIPLSNELTQGLPVDSMVTSEVQSILGSISSIRALVDTFFAGIHRRFTIIARIPFEEQLTSLTVQPRADVSALCLAMYLAQQRPVSPGDSMQSSAYITMKSIVSLLEATGYQSLRMVQCRALVTFYEFGHGLNLAASLSIGACAKAARAMQLRRPDPTSIAPTQSNGQGITDVSQEERKRLWWACFMLDRLLNLSSGDVLFVMEDPRSTEQLPSADRLWIAGNMMSMDSVALLNTSITASGIEQMARECQIAHLAGRTVRHVLEPSDDHEFHVREGVHLENALKSWLPLLAKGDLECGRFCAALSTCACALFVFYNQDSLRQASNDINAETLLAMEPVADTIAHYSKKFWSPESDMDFETMSPFIPLSVYQAAVVQCRLWKLQGQSHHEDALTSLRAVLVDVSKRWAIGGQYIRVLDTELPSLLPFRSHVPSPIAAYES